MTRPAEHLSEEVVQDYLDEALCVDEQARVDAHLASCARCAAEIEGWRTLFAGLWELPALGPSEGFAARVMTATPLRPSLVRRLAEGTRRAIGQGASSLTDHLSPQGIQDLLDGALGAGDRRRAEAHLTTCAPCNDRLHEWRPVFASLSVLEQIPAPDGFGDRVFSAWRAARPATLATTQPLPGWVPVLSRLSGVVARLLPSTPRGWAAAALLAVLPMLPLLLLVGIVLSHPLLTFDGLFSLASWRLVDGLQGIAGVVAVELLGHPFASWLWKGVVAFAQTPALAATGLLAGWSASLLSAWILYRHLIAPTSTRVPHA